MTLQDLISQNSATVPSFSLLSGTPSTNIFQNKSSMPSIFGPSSNQPSQSEGQPPKLDQNSAPLPNSGNMFGSPREQMPFLSNAPTPRTFLGQQLSTPSLSQYAPVSQSVATNPTSMFGPQGSVAPPQTNIFTNNPQAARMFENNVFMGGPTPLGLFGDTISPPQPAPSSRDYNRANRKIKPPQRIS
jgi:hypothetical protein